MFDDPYVSASRDLDEPALRAAEALGKGKIRAIGHRRLAEALRERKIRAVGRYTYVSKAGYCQNGGQDCSKEQLHNRGLPKGLVLVAYRLRFPNLSEGCLHLLQLWWNLELQIVVILPMYFQKPAEERRGSRKSGAIEIEESRLAAPLP